MPIDFHIKKNKKCINQLSNYNYIYINTHFFKSTDLIKKDIILICNTPFLYLILYVKYYFKKNIQLIQKI